jgi:hypothetical protein
LFRGWPAEAPTILRLFTQAEGSRPQGLSAWDQAFLSATYDTDPKSADQRGAIARVVARDLSRSHPFAVEVLRR